MAPSPFADLERGLNADRLLIFRTEVGIADVQPLGSKEGRRSAHNVGMYQRVTTAEKQAKLKCFVFATSVYSSSTLPIDCQKSAHTSIYVILTGESIYSSLNLCLLAQLILGAALTALGASNGSHTKITVIAAANTVLAGILSFVKGSGLPNRFKQFQSAMRVVREYIEQRERDFGRFDCKLDLDDEIRTIVSMYQEARKNDEDNHPDSYRGPQDIPGKWKSPVSRLIQPTFAPTARPASLHLPHPRPSSPEVISRAADKHSIEATLTRALETEAVLAQTGKDAVNNRS